MVKFRFLNRIINIDINTCQSEPRWKRQVINRVWDEYKAGRIHCWHVNTNDYRVNLKLFNNGNLLFAFSENKYTAATSLMREMKKGDVVFLYKNEKEGYTDMYQIAGNAYLRIERRQADNTCNPAGRSVSIFLTNESMKERLMSETEASQYNLYTAIGNQTGHVTCVLMSPLLKRMHKSNPFGLVKMLLTCLQSDNIMLLLEYFDSDDI